MVKLYHNQCYKLPQVEATHSFDDNMALNVVVTAINGVQCSGVSGVEGSIVPKHRAWTGLDLVNVNLSISNQDSVIEMPASDASDADAYNMDVESFLCGCNASLEHLLLTFFKLGIETMEDLEGVADWGHEIRNLWFLKSDWIGRLNFFTQRHYQSHLAIWRGPLNIDKIQCKRRMPIDLEYGYLVCVMYIICA